MCCVCPTTTMLAGVGIGEKKARTGQIETMTLAHEVFHCGIEWCKYM